MPLRRNNPSRARLFCKTTKIIFLYHLFCFKPMTELIACLSSGKGTWMEVNSIIRAEEWGKIFLVTNDFGRQNYKPVKEAELIVLDAGDSLSNSIEKIKKALDGKINGLEVALNISSGDGKEHTALLSALMQLGIGFRLVAFSENKIIEL